MSTEARAKRRSLPRWAWALIGIAGVIALLAGMIAGVLSSLCSFDLVDQQLSPDGRTKAGVVAVDCGATTDFARWLVLSPAWRPFWYRFDSVAAVEAQDLKIRWEGSTLFASYPAGVEPVIHKKVVAVIYQPVPRPQPATAPRTPN